MSGATPALVIVGYDRPDALAGLLTALRAGTYPDGVPLVISLDLSGDPRPGEVADAFEWPRGPKRVIRHPQRLGLRNHILSCGDLSEEYGAVIVLEDDLLAAPHLYAYVERAIDRFGADNRIAGISLYHYRINEFNNMDFEPIDDGSDVYFMQVAASWGQAWTASQWRLFRQWYARYGRDPIRVTDGVPRQLEAWRDNSWKRFYMKYLAMTGRYFVYPRASLTTNRARPGTNTKRAVSIYQTAMDVGARDWRLPALDQSLARYDIFYEPEPDTLRALQPALADADFDVDLYGVKPAAALTRPDLLSSRPARRGRLRFGLVSDAPAVASIIAGVPGSFFTLAPRDHFSAMSLGRRWALARATQVGRPGNAMMFQMLKPVQTEILIRKLARARRQAAIGE
ncbi:glycosyl transferase family 2 [Sphingomonas sp. SFZ2018-12]|uniref:hypothetical protein n=1 Tax=Sphingomonas sp. SFZ2018-12 TaxID=2683197 RepID=UPI001F0EA5DF|nr:hypothetical protein [Sphingomonas sp. SFZ2018-12]MCH4891674.1 glycosyl transferase family 2 [Sphingomonas sp. SFZ2018-12]